MIEKISHKDIPDNLLKETGKNKFSLYPVDFNGVLFHQDRWSRIDEAKVNFWAVIKEGVVQSVLEFHLNEYDTNLLGVKAGTIQYVFTNPDLEIEKKREVWQELIESFQLYRQKEEIKFCFIAVDNWESVFSLLLQQSGFRYILTWGKCFVQQPTDLVLPWGYTVRREKREKDLPLILNMAANYFKGGRFYMDVNISTQKADKVYRDLITNSFNNKEDNFIVLYNPETIPVGCFITPAIQYQFEKELVVSSIRLLVFDKKRTEKGVASAFLSTTSGLLLEKKPIIESGLEMHNLASLKMHFNAGYKVNHIYSAYHSWL